MRAIAEADPKSINDLTRISGIGEKKMITYGTAMIELLNGGGD